VYPAQFLKAKIIDWLKARFENSIQIAERYKDDKTKFDRALRLSKEIMDDLGWNTYTSLANKYFRLLTTTLHNEQSMKQQSAAYSKQVVSMSRSLPKDAQKKFVEDEIDYLTKQFNMAIQARDNNVAVNML